MEKQEFEGLTTMNLPYEGFRFNAKRVGPKNFIGLRNGNYGKGFRMPTMPELVPLVHASLGNQKYGIAKDVIKTLEKHWLTGNTGILYVPKGMFVQDNPELKDGRISMDPEVLESKLGSHEEKKVVFSDDGSVRFTPYDFKKELQNPLELFTNKGISALVGGEENAVKLATVAEHYEEDPYFWVLGYTDFPVTRVADMYSHERNNQFVIRANNDESFGDNYSFGVQEIEQE